MVFKVVNAVTLQMLDDLTNLLERENNEKRGAVLSKVGNYIFSLIICLYANLI